MAVVLISGCSSAVDPKNLQGRWLDQKQDAFWEISPAGLCAEVTKAPDTIVMYRWDLKGSLLKLRPLCKRFVLGQGVRAQNEAEAEWTVKLTGDSLGLSTKNGQRRRFKKVSDSKATSELAGLWKIKRDDGKVDYFEFTPWGDELGLGWFPPRGHPAEKRITPQPAPEWSTYTTVGEDLEMSGISPFRRGRKLRLTYKREGNKLTLTPGYQRGRRRRPAFTLTLADKVE